MSDRGPILVVDDDFDVREALLDVLTGCGFDVRAAGDGVEALALLDGGLVPRVILLDVMMPRMDAFAFRSAQRSHGAGLAAKVIVLSAAHDIEDAATRLDADRWLPKPFRLADVLVSVDELLDGGT